MLRRGLAAVRETFINAAANGNDKNELSIVPIANVGGNIGIIFMGTCRILPWSNTHCRLGDRAFEPEIRRGNINRYDKQPLDRANIASNSNKTAIISTERHTYWCPRESHVAPYHQLDHDVTSNPGHIRGDSV